MSFACRYIPLQFEMVTKLQDGEKSDDSEELQAHVAKDVSINDEDEQLREALYGRYTQTLFVVLQWPEPTLYESEYVPVLDTAIVYTGHVGIHPYF